MESRSLEKAKKIQDNLNRYNISLLAIDDQLYPAGASAFPTSPALLYYRGKLKEDSMGVAIIGSRRCTKYGKQVTADAATYLAEQGVPVISGMARGIDGYAHTACLKTGGYTIAILANGLDICYPPEHQILMEQIIENGAVISPYPPQTRPLKSNFYKRNALLSAWSFKVLVVEAGMKSGALSTAKFAEQQKKALLAAPNSIYSPESAGANLLISQGAKLYLEPAQLLPAGYEKRMKETLGKNAFNSKLPERQAVGQLSPIEKRILGRLKMPQNIEQMADIFDGNISALLDVLCSMELEGKIKISQGKKVSMNI
jgi:DNA processing protein